MLALFTTVAIGGRREGLRFFGGEIAGDVFWSALALAAILGVSVHWAAHLRWAGPVLRALSCKHGLACVDLEGQRSGSACTIDEFITHGPNTRCHQSEVLSRVHCSFWGRPSAHLDRN